MKKRKKHSDTPLEETPVSKQKKRVKEIQGKFAERWEENKVRMYFVRLFGKYDLRNEEQFIHFGKWLIFIVLCLVEILLLLQNLGAFITQKQWIRLTVFCGVEVVLTLSECMKLFVLKDGKVRHSVYGLGTLAACSLIFFQDGALTLVIYFLILTEFYIDTENNVPARQILLSAIFLYALSYVLKTLFVYGGEIKIEKILMGSVGVFFALGVHFVVVNIALAFYRQFLRLDKALTELDKSKRELEKAYEAVAEISALEERQRIAKDIHDTAGHSITTVIMQTEAAKRIFEENPTEAKNKLIAANLQAKHALEELRNSTHLLSGIEERQTLKDAFLGIIHESMDGTGIVIRSEIEDLEVSEAKHRFLCNTLKEGISNGLRHGGATAFWFEFKKEEDKLFFLLSDNGKGVDSSTWQKGFGLTTMQERVRSFGGEIFFETEIDEGFELRLLLPTDKE